MWHFSFALDIVCFSAKIDHNNGLKIYWKMLQLYANHMRNNVCKGFLTDCTLYAQFSEDQNSIFKPWGAICLVSAQ